MGNSDGGSKAQIGRSSSGHGGNNFGATVYFLTLYRPSAAIVIYFFLKLIFKKNLYKMKNY